MLGLSSNKVHHLLGRQDYYGFLLLVLVLAAAVVPLLLLLLLVSLLTIIQLLTLALTLVELLLLMVGVGGHEDTVLAGLGKLVSSTHLLTVVELLVLAALVELLDDTVGVAGSVETLRLLGTLVELLLLLLVLALIELVGPAVGDVTLLDAAVGLAHGIVELLSHALALGKKLILLSLTGVHDGAVGVGLVVKVLAEVLVALLILASLEVGLLAMGLFCGRRVDR